MTSPRFSVIIPLTQLSYTLIFESLPALAKQTYKKFEVLVLPNIHSQYDLTLLRQYPWLKIIPTGSITRPAEKRNMGAKNAHGEILAFIDDDAYPAKDWLEKANTLLTNKLSAACGPGVLPTQTNHWEKIFDQVLRTWFGSGNYLYRFAKQKARYVDDYPSMNFLVKKDLFLKLGGFNRDYWPGEDSKLCEDIVYKEHEKIFYSPNIVTHHHRRKDLKGYLKQHANYGFHRGAFFAHGDKNSRRLSYLIPTIFVLYVVSLFFFILYSLFNANIYHLISIIYYFPAFIYLFAVSYIFFLALLRTWSIRIAFGSVFVLFLTHIVYGIMFIKGFIKSLNNKNNIYG